MAKVLYITANPKPIKDSYSLTVGQEFVDEYKKVNPSDEVIHLDLFNFPVVHLDGPIIGCMFGQIPEESLDGDHKKLYEFFKKNVEQFMSADKYVFATPLWNFSVPTVMKAYFDDVMIVGKTFKYTETGAVGLLSGKSAVCIQAAGGIYSSGPAAQFEHGMSYIKSALTFLGIQVVDSILIEGVNIQSNDVEKIKAEAISKAKEIAKKF